MCVCACVHAHAEIKAAEGPKWGLAVCNRECFSAFVFVSFIFSALRGSSINSFQQAAAYSDDVRGKVLSVRDLFRPVVVMVCCVCAYARAQWQYITSSY